MWQQLEEGFWQRNRASKTDTAMDAAAEIIEKVRKDGDRALFALTEKFDKVKLDSLEVSREEIEAAYEEVDGRVVDEIEAAAYNIQRFHEMQRPKDLWMEEVEPGVMLGVKSTPLERIGCYIPGGRASYPSTALMCAIPARVAGVDEVVCCTPCPVNPLTLVAMDVAGVDEIYKLGGAQAIAAMALGTETVEPVQKIVGPGNVYVTAAKMLLRNDVEIDFPAGPSEVGIIADSSADPRFVAAEVMAQTEHDPSSAAVLVTDDAALAEAVGAEIGRMLAGAPRAGIIEAALGNSGYILADSLDRAVEIMNDMAPEHLSIQTADPFDALTKVRNAGSIFVGPYTPVPAGDYASGTNHVLPTAGNARTASGLNVAHFMKTSTVQMLTADGLRGLAPTIETLARAEGLAAHGEAVRVRLGGRERGPRDAGARAGPVQPGALHQPGAVLAGVQPQVPFRGDEPVGAAAGPGQVPGDMLQQPGRVLHDPGARPAPAGQGRPRAGGADAGLPGRRPAAGAGQRRRAGAGRQPRVVLEGPQARAGGERHQRARRGGPELRAEGLGPLALPGQDTPAADPAGAGRLPPLPVHIQQLPEPGVPAGDAVGDAVRPRQGADVRVPQVRARPAREGGRGRLRPPGGHSQGLGAPAVPRDPGPRGVLLLRDQERRREGHDRRGLRPDVRRRGEPGGQGRGVPRPDGGGGLHARGHRRPVREEPGALPAPGDHLRGGAVAVLPVGAGGHALPGAEGGAAGALVPAGAGRGRRRLRGAEGARLDTVPPVRDVRRGRPLPPGRGDRPAGPEHQDLPVQDRQGPVHLPGAEAGQGAGQVRLRPDGAAGQVRREQEHPVGQGAGEDRRPRGLRAGGPEGALQAAAGGPPGGRPPRQVHAHELRQLQREHRQAVRRHLLPHRRPGDRRGRGGAVQRPDRVLRAQAVQAPARRPRHAEGLAHRAHRRRDRGAEGARRRVHRDEGQRAGGRGHHRVAVPRVHGRREGGPEHPRSVLPAPRGAGDLGEHNGHQHRGQVPGARQDLLLRERRVAEDVHGVLGHDAPEPDRQGRGAVPRPGPEGAGVRPRLHTEGAPGGHREGLEAAA